MSHDYIDVKKLTNRITEVRDELAKLLHLESLLGISSKPKRGRKPNSAKVTVTKVKKTRKTKGKRGNVSEKILAYLNSKGKEGAHVKDVAAHTGSTPANVTAFMYTTGKKKGVKKVSPGTFAYVSKE